jgi:hypothetical protein
MQGIFINYRRPASKKAVKEAVAANPGSVQLEATSMLGNEYEGPVDTAPSGKYTFVGPDPYNKRSFYGTIVVKADGTVKVS